MPEITWTCFWSSIRSKFQNQKMKLSNCLANYTCDLLKVEDATESSAFFSLKLSFSRSAINILQHQYWKVVLVLSFKGLVVLWNVYLWKWWRSRKHPFPSLPKYMQVNGDKQLFAYHFYFIQRGNASRNITCGSFSSCCTTVFHLFIAVVFISTLFPVVSPISICVSVTSPFLLYGISTIPYKD